MLMFYLKDSSDFMVLQTNMNKISLILFPTGGLLIIDAIVRVLLRVWLEIILSIQFIINHKEAIDQNLLITIPK
jgi:hypothetical protein